MTTRLDAAQKAALAEIESLMRMAHEGGIAEGERRATAAIVAWFRTGNADLIAETPQRAMDLLADAIERGDHLTQP